MPAGVLLLPDFYKLVKKRIGGIGFRFIPLESPMFVVSETAQLPLSIVKCIWWTLVRECLCNKFFDI